MFVTPIKTSSTPSPSTSHNATGGEVTPARKSTCWRAAGLFQGLFGGASLTRCVSELSLPLRPERRPLWAGNEKRTQQHQQSGAGQRQQERRGSHRPSHPRCLLLCGSAQTPPRPRLMPRPLPQLLFLIQLLLAPQIGHRRVQTVTRVIQNQIIVLRLILAVGLRQRVILAQIRALLTYTHTPVNKHTHTPVNTHTHTHTHTHTPVNTHTHTHTHVNKLSVTWSLCR